MTGNACVSTPSRHHLFLRLRFLPSAELIVQGKGHGHGVDWWSFGILLYETLCGFSPFADPSGEGDQVVIYKNVLRGKLRFPSALKDAAARDIIARLLQPVVAQRLGCMKERGKDVLRHPFFASISWSDLLKGRIAPPLRPPVGKDPADTSCFDEVAVKAEEGTNNSSSKPGQAYSVSLAVAAGYAPDWDAGF